MPERIERDDAGFDFHARVRVSCEIDFDLRFSLTRIAGGRFKLGVHRIRTRQTGRWMKRTYAQRQASDAVIVARAP